MKLDEIHRRESSPEPWAEGDNIPWNEPGFSKRMLKEHLSQNHDAASRRFELIDRHVEWIHRQILSQRSSRVLDIGCGPGLYLERFASLGHECTGIDYSPASIEYAKQQAVEKKLTIDYTLDDIRKAAFGTSYDLLLSIYGELNVFSRSDAERILHKAADALTADGSILLEVHRFDAVKRRGEDAPSWFSSESGLFSDDPHICLQEGFWNDDSHTSTVRFFVIDTATSQVTRHSASYQAYTDDEYVELLHECGFTDPEFYPSLTGSAKDSDEYMKVLVARKR